MSQGGTLAFWAKTYVTLVTLDFASLFPCLFPIYRLLFFIMRRIHVNPSAQVSPYPWMGQVEFVELFINSTRLEIANVINPETESLHSLSNITWRQTLC